MRASILSVYISMVFAVLGPAVAQGRQVACGAYFGAGSEAARNELIQTALALRADDIRISGPTGFFDWGTSGNAYRVRDRGRDRVLKMFLELSTTPGVEPGPGEVEALAIQAELARRGFAPRIRAWFNHELTTRWAATHERELHVLRPAISPTRLGRILRYAVLMDEGHGISVKYPRATNLPMSRSAYRRAQATLVRIGAALEQIGALAIDIDYLVDQDGRVALIDLAAYRFRTPQISALAGTFSGEKFAQYARTKLAHLVQTRNITLVDD